MIEEETLEKMFLSAIYEYKKTQLKGKTMTYLQKGYEHKELLEEAHKEASCADFLGFIIDKMIEYSVKEYGKYIEIGGKKYKVTIEPVED